MNKNLIFEFAHAFLKSHLEIAVDFYRIISKKILISLDKNQTVATSIRIIGFTQLSSLLI